MFRSELLAPAGDYNSAVAAVEAGADAIYFGGKEFSARNFAVNFSREEIARVIRYAHLRGVKCYGAVNILIKDSEFSVLYDYINFLYAEGIDALIIQDLGVFNLCRKYFPGLALHASTQMSAHNLCDVLELEKMGFKRVVLARELTLAEIREIKNKCKIEIECFVHGALCFSYSGQCLLSSMIGGRSGNRGRCAQPCRKKYNLAEYQTGKTLDRSGYLLSTRDLCALDILTDLFFVDSLKIEGRMKSAAYVGGVVEKYRKAIESAARNEKIPEGELEADKKEMAALFNRGGFSHGYLLEKKPADLAATERSKNFGVKVGEVVEARIGWAKIRIENVNVDDGLEIWGRGGQEMNFGFRVEKISGDFIEIRPEENADIKVGDAVHKNFDRKLNKKLGLLSQENYQRRVPVSLEFDAEEGKAVILRINPHLFENGSDSGFKNNKIIKKSFSINDRIGKKAGAEARGEIAQKAQKKATDPEMIKAQLAKFGGTVFTAAGVKINIKGELNIPLKDLNAVRREAVKKLEKNIIDSFRRPEKHDPLVFPAVKSIKTDDSAAERKGALRQIAVQSDDPAVLDGLAARNISRIYTAVKTDIKKFHENNIEVFQALPRILRAGERLEIFSDYDGFLVPALGYLRLLPPQAKKTGDYQLNIFNSFSSEQLERMGFDGFTVSCENTADEINDLAAGKMAKEAIVYGYLPLMTAEHCVLFGSAFCRKKNCGVNPRFSSEKNENILENKLVYEKSFSAVNTEVQKVGVTDDKKITFPVFTDCANCRMRILNSRPLYFTDIGKLEADSIRLIHTIETSGDFLKKVDNYLSGEFGFVENTTTGHFNRGVE